MVRVGAQFRVFGDLMAQVARRVAFPGGRALPAKWSIYGWTIVATLIGLTLGTYAAVSWQAETPRPVVRPESSRQLVADTIAKQEADQAELKKQVAQLREQIAQQQAEAAKAKTALAEINAALESQKMAAGMVALKGPGLRVTIDDSSARTIPSGEEASLYIVHEFQLRDIVNALWQSGAEAIAVNGERLVGTTSIYCVGSTIMVNATRLSPPYEIVAIGDAAAMDNWLNNQSVLVELKDRIKTYELQFKTVRSQSLEVPAYNGSLTVRYASTGGTQ